jgi:hypothetical protein
MAIKRQQRHLSMTPGLLRKIHQRVQPSQQQGLRTRVQLKALVRTPLVPRVKPQRQQSRPLLLALLTRGRLRPFLLRLLQLLRQVPRQAIRN